MSRRSRYSSLDQDDYYDDEDNEELQNRRRPHNKKFRPERPADKKRIWDKEDYYRRTRYDHNEDR